MQRSISKSILLCCLVATWYAVPVSSVECEGVCDNTSCDFLDDMCLNKLDTLSGDFSLPATPCRGSGIGLFAEIILFLFAMLGLAIVCDDWMCMSLERMCDIWMIREDVAGATFMAFGSAAPEIIINMVSTLKQARSYPPPPSALDATNVGVGAIIGSGMIAFLIIPGACALFSDGIELKLKRRPLLRDIGFYAALLVMLYCFLQDGIITMGESLTLVLTYVVYVSVVVLSPKIRRNYRRRFLKRAVKKRKSFVNKDGKKGGNNNNAVIAALIEEDNKDDADEQVQRHDIVSPLLPAGAGHGQEEWERDLEGSSEATDKSVKFVELAAEVQKDAASGNADLSVTLVKSDEDGAKVPSAADAAEVALESGHVVSTLKVLSKPLVFLFEWTMPNCEEGAAYEAWYPLTFAVSFIWVSFFSTIISSCVQRWTSFTPAWAQGGFFGLLTIAIGAEIPDTIQSVTMAKRGYGSMAVSNALGSQIINIALGLGLSWLIANIVQGDNEKFQVTDHADLSVAAIFQFGAVLTTFTVLLGVAVVTRANKALLSPEKGKLMIGLYVCVIAAYIAVMLYRHSGPGPCSYQ